MKAVANKAAYDLQYWTDQKTWTSLPETLIAKAGPAGHQRLTENEPGIAAGREGVPASAEGLATGRESIAKSA